MNVATASIPEDWDEKLDQIAEEHDTSRSAVLRSVIDNGLRAHKYHPDEFAINPERYEQADAVELVQRGELPR